jgi:hypothetical protein
MFSIRIHLMACGNNNKWAFWRLNLRFPEHGEPLQWCGSRKKFTSSVATASLEEEMRTG